MSNNPLGEQIPHPTKYNPGILYPIPRWAARSLLDIDKKIPMFGIDHWHAYELSWLDNSGKPMIAIGEFYFDSDSENIVESKSLKLYLNSLNSEKFESVAALSEIISDDLSAVSKSKVEVLINDLGCVTEKVSSMDSARSLDSHSVSVDETKTNSLLLKLEDDAVFDEELSSNLFRSNCPVTGQPDWASFRIQYTGSKINEAGLLSYICSFREHQGYHEECAERMFRDILEVCRPAELLIALNFLRRGGLDINVYRSTNPISSESVHPRLERQ